VPAQAPTRLSELSLTLSCLDRPPLVVHTALRDSVAIVLPWRLGCAVSEVALGLLAELAAERPTIAALAVHSPVLAAERDPARLARAVRFARASVTIAIDESREFVRRCGLRALPAVVLVDAIGAIRFVGHGLLEPRRLLAAVDQLLREADDRGARDEGRVERHDLVLFGTPRGPGVVDEPAAALAPTAIASDGDTLWVGSRSRGSVLAVTVKGEVAAEIAGPRWPTAIVATEDHVLVSDWGRHALWSVERAGTAEIVLGTGECGSDPYGGGFGEEQELALPSGLTGAGGSTGAYFAQAGTHQIWQFDPETRAASAWVGTGSRGLVDGGEEAEFSEPRGIAGNDHLLAVADAGNDGVRIVELGHNFCETIAQGLDRPVAVAFGPAAEDGGEQAVYAALSYRPAIVRIAPGGDGRPEPVLDASHGLIEPVGLTFNAMGRIHHRDAGVAVLALDDPRVTCPLIVDGVHVQPAMVRLALRQKGADRIVLVTDAVSAAGMPNGDYTLSGISVRLEDGIVRDGEGRLAGSALTMAQAARNVLRFAPEIGPWTLARLASTNPARLIGQDGDAGYGAIQPGGRAAFTFLGDDGSIRVVRGQSPE